MDSEGDSRPATTTGQGGTGKMGQSQLSSKCSVEPTGIFDFAQAERYLTLLDEEARIFIRFVR